VDRTHAVRLPTPSTPAVRDELDEHEVATAVVGRRITDDESLDVRKFHADPLLEVDVTLGGLGRRAQVPRRLRLPRINVSAKSADASIRKRLTAFSTGVALAHASVHHDGEWRIGADPASKSFEVLERHQKRNCRRADERRAQIGNVMVRNTAACEAPRLSAASSRVRSKRSGAR